jgi:hypothetical protein
MKNSELRINENLKKLKQWPLLKKHWNIGMTLKFGEF